MREKLRSAFNRRQYMLARDYEIYYYSDDTFQNVESHTHDYYEFYIFLDGNVRMEIGGTEYPLSHGDIVLIPPAMPHRAVKAGEGAYRRFVFWISEAFAASLLKQSPDYVWLMQFARTQKQYLWHLGAADYNTVQTKVLRLLEESKEERYGKSAAMSIAAEDLILSINRAVYENTQKQKLPEEDLFTRIVQYIDAHPGEALSLDSVSSRFYISKYYLSHLFTDSLGVSMHRYVMKKRLQGCRDAILSGQNPTDVCSQFGFQDYSSFYRAFRKEYGTSPRECRKRHMV